MPRRPNFLLLFTDQHAAGVLGCEGHPDVLTPNLDALAAGGVRFRRAYCQNAICLPSRSSLMTGQYPRSLGLLDNRGEARGPVLPLARILSDAGYACAAFGKRHLRPVGSAIDQGWHEAASTLHAESPQDSYITWLDRRGLLEIFATDWAAEFAHGPDGSRLEATAYPYALMSVRPTALPVEATMEAWTAQRSMDFLRRQSASDRPFFCWSSFYRPHQPYTPHPEFLRLYDASAWGAGRRAGGGLSMPASLRQDPATLPPTFQEWMRGSNRVWRLDLARQDERIYRDYIAAYYALVSEVDHWIGEILGELDRLGMREDTVILYTADHGDFVGAHGMVEKCSSGHNIYEDTLRVPLIAAWDGVRRGSVRDDLVELVDALPTVLDLAGVPAPADPAPHGRSLRGVAERGEDLGRSAAFSENATQSTVITDRHKLGCLLDAAGGIIGEQFFDRAADPLELRDAGGDPATADVRERLRGQLRDWQRGIPDRRFPVQSAAARVM